MAAAIAMPLPIESYEENGLHMIRYRGSLYRAETYSYPNAQQGITRANEFYRNDPKVTGSYHVHFFTTRESETRSYENRYERPSRQWRVANDEELHLVDIMNVATRRELEQRLPAAAVHDLAIAFPIRHQRVIRHSEEDTAVVDRRVVMALCQLPNVDGYYMERQVANHSYGAQSFHSEIGLCVPAFHKLVLVGKSERRIIPSMKRKSQAQTRRNRSPSPSPTKQSARHALFQGGRTRRLQNKRTKRMHRLR